MAENRKFKLSKKHILAGIGLVAAIVVTIGLGALVRWLQVEWEANNPDSQKTGQLRPPREGTDIQDLQSQGKTEEADKRINEVLSNPNSTNEQKYITYIQQGNGFVNSGNVQAGIDAYVKAYEMDQTYEIVILLADTYAQVGNKPKAIEFYQKALQNMPASPIAETEKDIIRQKIVALGGQA